MAKRMPTRPPQEGGNCRVISCRGRIGWENVLRNGGGFQLKCTVCRTPFGTVTPELYYCPACDLRIGAQDIYPGHNADRHEVCGMPVGPIDEEPYPVAEQEPVRSSAPKAGDECIHRGCFGSLVWTAHQPPSGNTCWVLQCDGCHETYGSPVSQLFCCESCGSLIVRPEAYVDGGWSGGTWRHRSCEGKLEILEPNKQQPSGEHDAGQADKVYGWRLEQLVLQAGYPVALAEELAAKNWHEVDLHVACELLARGCPVETARRILL